jgi:hypothetical protein
MNTANTARVTAVADHNLPCSLHDTLPGGITAIAGRPGKVGQLALRQLNHGEADRSDQLGNLLITCLCGHRESGGIGDRIAERNIEHHYKTARALKDMTR